ncbi:aspartate-semialdehyde dehydrogenase [Escherichia coli]|uniref:Aspartate-semialdehyde dehydrogenase n=1 Tax=Escherichia coli TaxID=562 RepID=A0A376RD59_ECOLX|nr:aspartate-semialdehyde dehydrogenase [Escherichia coli]
MKNVGFIGWRGMVGSVLMQRMVEERDFDAIRPVFFSTSQLGQAAPSFGGTTGTLQDAFDLEALKPSYHCDLSGRRLYQRNLSKASWKADGKVTGLTQHRLCA